MIINYITYIFAILLRMIIAFILSLILYAIGYSFYGEIGGWCGSLVIVALLLRGIRLF